MGKKNKYLDWHKKKSGKKNKKDKATKTAGYSKPKIRNIKPTLDKDAAKANRKIVLSPVDVPEKFVKARKKCNHAGSTISVAEYKGLTPNYAAYTPVLDEMITKYGEDKLAICKDCYDVLVNMDLINADAVKASMLTLYAAVNMAVSNSKLKKDEVKEINGMKDLIQEYRTVHNLVGRIKETASQQAYSDYSSDVNALNRETSGAFVQ